MTRTDRTRRQRAEPATTATPSTPPDHVGLLAASLIMTLAGGGGLYWLIFASGSLPRIGAELWLFFVLLLITVSGLALPVVRFLNVRFTPLDQEVPPAGVIVRQSVWVGLFVVMCAWLQIPRILTLPIAIFIIVVFIIIESFLRTREIASEKDA
jgi:hypothetical protein